MEDKVIENGGNQLHDGFDRFEMKDTKKPVSSLPSREAVRALEDSLLKVKQELFLRGVLNDLI